MIMKKLSVYLLAFLLVPSILFTSCKDDTSTTDPSFGVLKDYMVANDLDLDAIIKYHDATSGSDVKFVVGAPAADALDAFLSAHYIMDIRSADDFNANHIDGAINVAFTDILTEAANAGDKQICVVCYTGQTACYATSLLRLYGFRNAQALKWGMSGWNETTAGPWNSNIGNVADGNANWSYDAAPAAVTYNAPDWTSTLTDGAEILKDRVETVVAEGFKTVTASDAIEHPGNYFINNYFSETDYTGFGHIAGAHRINPLLLSDESVLNIDPTAKVVTYCYTGQTSAVITAFLRVMGYDAYSLTFGMNGLFNSNPSWTSNQWGGDSNPADLPLVSN